MDYRRLEKEIEEKMNTPNPDVRHGTNMKKERNNFILAFSLSFSIFLVLVIIIEILGLKA